jgi:hypothetical protein
MEFISKKFRKTGYTTLVDEGKKVEGGGKN